MKRQLAALSLSLGLIGAGTVESAEIIGTAGSIQMDAAQVRTLLSAMPEPTRAAVLKDATALEQLVRADLVSRALLAEAEAGDFSRKAETVAALNRIRSQALTELWMADQTRLAAAYPAESEVAEAFEKNRSQLRSPGEFHLAQIYIKAPDATDPATLARALRKATELAPKLAAAGADFGKLARENTDQVESAAKDGDLGWLAEDKIAPEVLGAVRTLKVGEIAGPVKTAQGFHYLKLLESKPGRALTLDESRERLVAALRARRTQELQQKYLAALNARLAISINQVGLASIQKATR